MNIEDSVAYGNSATGVNATSGVAGSSIMLNRVALVANVNFGIRANGASEFVRFGYSTITANGTATSTNNNGTLGSFGNNRIFGNSNDTIPPLIQTH